MSGLLGQGQNNLEEYRDYCVIIADKTKQPQQSPKPDVFGNLALSEALAQFITGCENKIKALFAGDDKLMKTVNGDAQLDWAYVHRWAKKNPSKTDSKAVSLGYLIRAHRYAAKTQRIVRELNQVKALSKFGRGVRAVVHALSFVVSVLAFSMAGALVLLNPVFAPLGVVGGGLFHYFWQSTNSEKTLRKNLYGRINKLSTDNTRKLGLTFGSGQFAQEKNMAKDSEKQPLNSVMPESVFQL